MFLVGSWEGGVSERGIPVSQLREADAERDGNLREVLVLADHWLAALENLRQEIPLSLAILSYIMYLSISFKRSTPPQNRQLMVHYCEFKDSVDVFCGEVDFLKLIHEYVL